MDKKNGKLRMDERRRGEEVEHKEPLCTSLSEMPRCFINNGSAWT